MFENNQPLARKSKRLRTADREALTEDQPIGEAGTHISTDPAMLTARQSSRLLASLLPVQVLRKRANRKARRRASRLAARRPKLVQDTVKRFQSEFELVHANAELSRFDEEHEDSEPGRLGRAMRSPYKQLAIGGLAVLDVVAYAPAVVALFNLEENALGRGEMILLSMISIGMVVTGATAAHFLKLYHEELAELEIDEARDEGGKWNVSMAGRIHRWMAWGYGAATVGALVAGSLMRLGNTPLFSTKALAMTLFSAIPVAGASAIEYLATSGLRHRRDGLVNEQTKAIRGMKVSVKTESRYRKRWELLCNLWSTVEPVAQVQVIDAEVDIMAAHGEAANGLNPADGRVPDTSAIVTSERFGLGVEIDHLAPETVIAEARAIAAAGFPPERVEELAEDKDHALESVGLEADAEVTDVTDAAVADLATGDGVEVAA